MENSYTHPTPFNSFNRMKMRIILNKLDGVGMRSTHPKSASRCHPY